MIHINVMTRRMQKTLSMRRWFERHPEQNRANCRAWYKANPEKAAELKRAWTKANIEKVREYFRIKARARRLLNPERYRRNELAWRKKNREICRAKEHRRRARKLCAEGSFTALQFKNLCTFYGNICLCCKRTENDLAPLKLVPDHIVALACGGSNDISNIQPLCGTCNARKQTKHIDYRKEIEKCQEQAMKTLR